MNKQGIKGPAYKFLHGSTKEAAEMVRVATSKPLAGFSHKIPPRVLPNYHAWIKDFGKNILTWKGPVPQLFVSDLEFVKEILNNKDGAFIKIPTDNFLKKLIGDGIVTAEGEKWFRQRKIANHAFCAENVKAMIPAIITSVEDMLNKWTEIEGKEIELYREFRVMASDVISKTAFGSSYLEGKDIFAKMDKIGTFAAQDTINPRFPLFRNIFRNSKERESDTLEMEIQDTIAGLIKKREESNIAENSDEYGNDLLGLLVKANHANNKKDRVSFEDIMDECKTFYFAGQETTVSLLAWTCLLLAMNTDWQDKAREEVTDLFGSSRITSDDANNIARLKTMNLILNESLRLYAPIVLITRQVAKEVKLGEYTLPKDLQIFISPLIVHHDTDIWGNDAHLFKPERFSEGIAKATNNTMSFLPFGAGPRNCVGKGLAMMEAKIALSMILQKYSFCLSPTYVHAPYKLLTGIPQYGIQIIVQKI